MSRLPDLADRIERLLLRHDEQKRTNALLEQQLRNVTDERDNLRSRLAAARARIDALIDRLPAEVAQVAAATEASVPQSAAGGGVHGSGIHGSGIHGSGIHGSGIDGSDEAGRPVPANTTSKGAAS